MSAEAPDEGECTLEELRQSWRKSLALAVPAHSSRDLLARALAYHLEAQRSKAPLRKLHQRLRKIAAEFNADPNCVPSDAGRLRAGTVLVRDWGGKRYVVTATEEGFLLDGQTFGSLSAVASAITGAKWSGPRFFELTKTEESKTP